MSIDRSRGRGRDRLAVGGAVGLAAVLFLFVGLPLLAVISKTSPDRLLAELTSQTAKDALLVSLMTTVPAVLLVVIFGTPTAYLLSRRSFPGSRLLLAVLELPLVLPPAVAGIALLMAFGRTGVLGGSLSAAGIEIPFTRIAVVMALAYVSLPFFARQAVASFSAIDERYLVAAGTLGAGPARRFFVVSLPLCRQALVAGAVLAWARALGEFGATLVFAGSFAGRTQTLPLAIYESFSTGDVAGALSMSTLLIAVSAGLFLTVRTLLKTERGAESL